MRRFVLLIIFLLVLVPGNLRAINVETLTGSADEYHLGKDLEYLEDKSGSLELKDVRDSGGWFRKDSKIPNFGLTRSAFWCRMALANTVPVSEWYLELANPSIDYVDLYVQDEKGRVMEFHTGDRLPFAQRDVPHRTFIFRLNLDAGRYVLYMRTRTLGAMIIPVTLWSHRGFQTTRAHDIMMGIYFGIMAAMFFYNLFLFISLRDTNYFYYILYIAGFIMFQLIETGLASQYFWPSYPQFANDINHVIIMFLVAATLLFTRKFLMLKENLPFFNRVFIALIAINFALMVAVNFVDFQTRMFIGVPMVLFCPPLILAMGIVTLVRGYRPALYFVIAWSVVLVMSFLGNAELGGLLPTYIFIAYGVPAGNVIEVLLLSFALAYRIDLLKKENLRVNLENMEKEHRLDIIRSEMEIARRIQNSILPRIPALEPYFSVAAVYAPIEEIGGDFYDFFEVDKKSLGAIIADVSGHGVPAALISSMVKMIFSVQKKIASDPALLLNEMNSSLLSRCGEHFVTAGYCYIDRASGTISFANAGHHPAMVLKRTMGRCDTLETYGRAMGVFTEVNCASISSSVEKGDRIILYTDGIIECRNDKDELYGEERFAGFIVDNSDADAKEFCARCMKGLKEWAGTMPYDDDITLVVIDLL